MDYGNVGFLGNTKDPLNFKVHKNENENSVMTRPS